MRYVCQICGYVYDDTVEKVPFSELPDDWKCPMCGASKSDFKPEITPESVTEKTKAEETVIEEDLEKLSVGQLAAICSNLSRGCEKQYKNDEAKQFKKLADYFSSVTPSVSDATVENISSLLQTDIKNYPIVRAEADAAADRGAARVCVWGEKVTRMLASLVDRYLKEGEQMLADTDIWVCTVCGFVYIGKNPPEMCPVCKVPSWKFKKIEGRAK
jgi:rubrerythrin